MKRHSKQPQDDDPHKVPRSHSPLEHEIYDIPVENRFDPLSDDSETDIGDGNGNKNALDENTKEPEKLLTIITILDGDISFVELVHDMNLYGFCINYKTIKINNTGIVAKINGDTYEKLTKEDVWEYEKARIGIRILTTSTKLYFKALTRAPRSITEIDILTAGGSDIKEVEKLMKWNHEKEQKEFSGTYKITAYKDIQYIDIFDKKLTLQPWIFKPRQCYNCQGLGHTSLTCKNETICRLCAGKHSTKSCPTKMTGELIPKCANCKREHPSSSAKCPIKVQQMKEKVKKQREIKNKEPDDRNPTENGPRLLMHITRQSGSYEVRNIDHASHSKMEYTETRDTRAHKRNTQTPNSSQTDIMNSDPDQRTMQSKYNSKKHYQPPKPSEKREPQEPTPKGAQFMDSFHKAKTNEDKLYIMMMFMVESFSQMESRITRIEQANQNTHPTW